jgi:1-acyl-sn-glycerol-3-phosphate acyltransferase
MPAVPTVNPFCEAVLRWTLLPFIRAVWRPRLVDTGHFPQGPCFVYGNHSHNLDPFTLNLFTRWRDPTTGVLTMEYMRKGVTAYLFKGIGLLATRKTVPEPHLIRTLYRLLDQGRMIVIYPEAGRRWVGRPSKWMVSTAKIFARAGVPIYPVLTHGSYVCWPRWARYPRPGRMRVECRPPLRFSRGTPWQEALEALKAPIAIDENVVPDGLRPRSAYRPADGIERILYRDPDTGENDGLYSPDGTHIVNRAGTIRWRMLPDSRLRDEATGETLLTGDLYDRIRALPLTTDAEGVIVRNRVDVAEERDASAFVARGTAKAQLHEDAIRLHGVDAGTTHIPLEAIRYIGIERNHKLQLTLDERTVQLSFVHGGSALQWEDTLRRLTDTNGVFA